MIISNYGVIYSMYIFRHFTSEAASKSLFITFSVEYIRLYVFVSAFFVVYFLFCGVKIVIDSLALVIVTSAYNPPPIPHLMCTYER